MKPNTKKYIIIIVISAVVVLASAAVLALTTAKVINSPNSKLYGDLASWGILIGLTPLIFASIYLHLGRKVYKRSCAVLQRYKNMGDGVYVQGYYGNRAADKANGMHNTVSVLGAMTFAAVFGVGAYTVRNSRIKAEFFMVNGEMYVNGISNGYWGDEYIPIDDMHSVYKGWYIRHELNVTKKGITVTGSDGQSYIYLDLKTCSTDMEGLLTALNEVFGKAKNDAEIVRSTPPSPFGDL
ncbi:MAG: hypothetical protein K2K38_00295 [Clostridia bacterium]|nr:hypothetical protein [Clostridia bacterium]